MTHRTLQFIRNHGGYWFGHLPGVRKIIVSVEDFINNKGLPTSEFRHSLALAIHQATGNSIFYLNYESGSDAADGSSWANAWKTITSGATAARIAPGDTIRVAKSPAPASLGIQATWTNLSKTVTLASALNANIDLCEGAWTAGAGGDTTVALTAVATDGKEGSNCMKLTLDSSVQTSKLQAYKATGTLNLSAYQKITFWIKNSAAVADANRWVVKLCSDTAGVTAVDTFVIPAIPSTYQWIPLTIARTGGGNLGSSIQSIAIYTGSSAPTASSFIYVDDFVACTTDGLNLQSLISKNSGEQGGTEAWYGIQSINDVTVMLDNGVNTKGNAGRGYWGTTETVTTYKRETIKIAMQSSSTTSANSFQDNGTLASYIRFEGGYNTTSSVQEGETFWDGLNGQGFGIGSNNKTYNSINYFDFCRFYYGFDMDAYDEIINLNNANNNYYGVYLNGYCAKVGTIYHANNNDSDGVYSTSFYRNIITEIKNANNNGRMGIEITNTNGTEFKLIGNANNNYYYGVQLGINSHDNIIYEITLIKENAYGGIAYYQSDNNKIYKLHTNGNSGSAITYSPGFGGSATNFIANALIDEASELGGGWYGDVLYSHNHDQTADNHWIFFSAGTTNTVNSQTTTRHTASGIAWRFTCGSNAYDSFTPMKMTVAKIACSANNLVTAKVWMKKDHATNVAGKLICRGGQLAGVASDVSDTKADDTDWEELTVTFTPTEAGVIEIEVHAWYVAGASYVYVDDVTVTQA